MGAWLVLVERDKAACQTIGDVSVINYKATILTKGRRIIVESIVEELDEIVEDLAYYFALDTVKEVELDENGVKGRLKL